MMSDSRFVTGVESLFSQWSSLDGKPVTILLIQAERNNK